MSLRPKLNITCGRCGRPREGLVHVCRSNSRRAATPALKLSFGQCPKCRKQYDSPLDALSHTCAPKSGFKRRRATFAREQKRKAREAARKKRQAGKHDYQACTDQDCPRSLCVAFKAGYRLGDQEGHERGFELGYAAGFPDGQDACPRSHL